MNKRERIFISYRRDGGSELARLVNDSLKQRGFNVFMDVEDLKSGPFDESLLREIDASKDVVVILSAGSLDRCTNEGDWLRWEVAHAIAAGKNIVTVLGREFAWPAQPLPDDLKQLPFFQGIEPSHELFSASIAKLEKLLKARRSLPPVRRLQLALALAGLAGVIALFAWLERPHGALSSSANDNYDIGRDLCFHQDDWKQGLPLLARKGGVLKQVASADLECTTDELNVARQWLFIASKVDLADQWHCFRRARYWYRKAIERARAGNNSNVAGILTAEMGRVPALKTSFRIKGSSCHREKLVVRRNSMTWSTYSGCGPDEIIGLTNSLPPFRFAYGRPGTRAFSASETQMVIPDGIDFTTAKLVGSQYSGRSGHIARANLRQLDSENGLEITLEEKKNVKGIFSFDVIVQFGD